MLNIAKINVVMTNSKELFNDLAGKITINESIEEIKSIVYVLLQKQLGLSKTDILSEKKINITDRFVLNEIIKRINQYEPIQYILGEGYFYDRPFYVNQHVLIPRPETELLVNEIIQFVRKNKITHPRILDIGTGSGCIAITLALEAGGAKVQAIDISEDALDVAHRNAKSLNTKINFQRLDILNESIHDSFDIIVSNPPYIGIEEKITLEKGVIDYEPHLALFAPAENVLKFYEVIAEKSKSALNEGGTVWVEINYLYSDSVFNLFMNQGFSEVKLIKDLDQKDRIVMAKR